MQPVSIDLPPFKDFETASRTVLEYLHRRLGFSLWMMTRTEGPDWIVLQAEDHGYSVEEGTVFRWADSFCSRMVAGQGPRVAPNTALFSSYREAPLNREVRIGAYIGVPVRRDDGTLFGTLCAIDPQPQNDAIQEDQPLVELLARLLATVLAADVKALRQARELERSQQEALTDALTGVLNRRAWQQSLAVEESRARRYGSPACVLIVDLDGLKRINDTMGHARGDAYIRSAAQSLKSAVRENDLVARIGGDEFAILAIECDREGSEALFAKVTQTLSAAGIQASVGRAMREPAAGLEHAVAEADRKMYQAKLERRGADGSSD